MTNRKPAPAWAVGCAGALMGIGALTVLVVAVNVLGRLLGVW